MRTEVIDLTTTTDYMKVNWEFQSLLILESWRGQKTLVLVSTYVGHVRVTEDLKVPI